MENEAERVTVGGMALCEGVMMRADHRWAMAVRRPDGTLAMRTGEAPPWAQAWSQIPFARGVVALAEAMVLGITGMAWSVAQAQNDDDQPAPPVPIGRVLLVALSLVIGVFFLVPGAVARLAVGGSGAMAIASVEGTVRVGMLIAYLVVIGRLRDVRRLFSYHGAEHMAVAAYDSGGDITVENARRFSTAHPRCGTTFLLLVMVLAVLAHAVAGAPESIAAFMVTHVALLPVIAGVAYEVLRLLAAASRYRVLRPLLAPALALQALTTRVPDDEQLAIALAALHAALEPSALDHRALTGQCDESMHDGRQIPSLALRGAAAKG